MRPSLRYLLYRKEQLAFAEIRAPSGGLIIRRDRDPGDVLVPGASLMQIVSLDELWVSAWVDETAIPALAVGAHPVPLRSAPHRAGSIPAASPALAARPTAKRVSFSSMSGSPNCRRIGPSASAFRMQNIGFVFQKPNLIPFLTALENVQVALEINDTPPSKARARALELLDYLSVRPRADNLPDALSGGEQQRVAIARALANDPSLILADEPTASLDGTLGRQVMEFFAKVAHERRAGVLVVTHDARPLDVEDGAIRVRATPNASMVSSAKSKPE